MKAMFVNSEIRPFKTCLSLGVSIYCSAGWRSSDKRSAAIFVEIYSLLESNTF